MGLKNAPPHFQRCVNKTLQAAGLHHTVGAFIDDLANGGATTDRAIAAATDLFRALDRVNFRAGADKVFLGMTRLPLVGYVLTEGHLTVDSERVAAIAALRPPETRS